MKDNSSIGGICSMSLKMGFRWNYYSGGTCSTAANTILHLCSAFDSSEIIILVFL